MSKIVAIITAVVLLAGAMYAYHLHSVGVIEPHEIWPEALGQTKNDVIARLGRPRDLDKPNERVDWAFWQGRAPYSWVFTIWFVDGVAVHIEMPNDLVGLKIEDLTQRLDDATNWITGAVTHNDGQSFVALTNRDRSIVVYDTGLAFVVANDASMFWK